MTTLQDYYAKANASDYKPTYVPLRPKSNKGEFSKGLAAFGDETQALGGGLLALGAEHLRPIMPDVVEKSVINPVSEYGLEVYDRNMEEATAGDQAPNIARVEDIKGVGDFGDWAAYNLGKGLPQLAGLGAGSVIGRQVAKKGISEGVKRAAKSEIGSKEFGQTITKDMQGRAKDEIRKRLNTGTKAGGFLAGASVEGGHAFGEAIEEGVDPERAKWEATAVGGINGALEFLPLYHVAKGFGRGDFAKNSIRNIIKGDKGLRKTAIELAQRSLKAGGAGLATEGVTEGLQELTNIAALRWAKEDPMFADLDSDDWSRIGNAMAVGGLVGGTVGGAAGPFKGPEGITEPIEPIDIPVEEPVVQPEPVEGVNPEPTVAIPPLPEELAPEAPVISPTETVNLGQDDKGNTVIQSRKDDDLVKETSELKSQGSFGKEQVVDEETRSFVSRNTAERAIARDEIEDGQVIQTSDGYVIQQQQDKEANSTDVMELHTFASPKRVGKMEEVLELVKGGRTAEQIRQKTGAFVADDGKWRVEIDDSQGKFNLAKWKNRDETLVNKGVDPDNLTVGDFLAHPALYETYPEAKDIKIVRDVMLKSNDQGWFNRETNTIGINKSIHLKSGGNRDPYSTVLHEIQHWIQHKEGFATGGNDMTVWLDLSDKQQDLVKGETAERVQSDIEDLIKVQAFMDKIENDPVWADFKLKRDAEEYISYSKIQEIYKDITGKEYSYKSSNAMDIISYLQGDEDAINPTDQITKLTDSLQEMVQGDEDATRTLRNKYSRNFELYERLAGETEARLTEARMELDEATRLLIHPDETRANHQNVRYGKDETFVKFSEGVDTNPDLQPTGIPQEPVEPETPVDLPVEPEILTEPEQAPIEEPSPEQVPEPTIEPEQTPEQVPDIFDPANNPDARTAESLRADIINVLGEDLVTTLERLGAISITSDTHGTYGWSGPQAGFNTVNGTVTLYGGNWNKVASPAGVFLHEGSHMNLDKMLGGKLGGFVKDIQRQAEAGNTIAQQAIDKALTEKTLREMDGTVIPDFFLNEETAAYYIQYSYESGGQTGLTNRMFDGLRRGFRQSWLGRLFASLGMGVELTPAMAVEYARAAIQDTAEIVQEFERLGAPETSKYTPGSLSSITQPNTKQVKLASKLLDEDPSGQIALRDTGIWKDTENNLHTFVEERDIFVKDNLDMDKIGKLGDVLDSPSLFNLYPDLKSHKVKFVDMATPSQLVGNTIQVSTSFTNESLVGLKPAILMQVDEILAMKDGWKGFTPGPNLYNYPVLNELRTRVKEAVDKGDVNKIRLLRELQRAMRDEELAQSMEEKLTSESSTELFSQVQPNDKFYYSELTRQVEGLKQAKAPVAQWKAILSNLTQKGVKSEEIAWSGVNDWLAEQEGTVLKADLIDYLRNQEVQITETVKESLTLDQIQQIGKTSKRLHKHIITHGYLGFDGIPEALSAIKQYDDWAARWDVTDPEFIKRGDEYKALYTESPEFEQYTTEGVYQDYKEILLRLPEEGEIYTSPRAHWDEKNVLAFTRFNTRTIDGKKTLFIEEIQSDWHQAGRKEGYDGFIPDAPFKNTPAWSGVVIKRLARYAVDNGFEQLGWTSGKLQNERYAKENLKGMEDFYDKIIPNVFNKFGKKFGAKAGVNQINVRGSQGLTNEQLQKKGYDKHPFSFMSSIDSDTVSVENTKTGEMTEFPNRKEAEAFAYDELAKIFGGMEDIWVAPVTDKMKVKATEGFALFSNTNITDGALADLGMSLGVSLSTKVNEPIPTDELNSIVSELPARLKDLKSWALTDPNNPDEKYKLGWMQRLYLNIVDAFATIKTKSIDIYDEYDLAESRKASQVDEINRRFFNPLRDMVKDLDIDVQEVNDWLAARHILLDNVNQKMAERASDDFITRLIKHLPKGVKEDAKEARDIILTSAEGKDATLTPEQARKMMFDLMNKYSSQELPHSEPGSENENTQLIHDEWQLFKQHASGMFVESEGLVNTKEALDAKAIYNRYRDNTKMQDIGKKYSELTRHQLELLRDGHLISEKEMNVILADKQYYVPLRREAFDYETAFDFLENTGVGPAKGISTRFGSAILSQPIHVIQNGLANTHRAAAAGQKNLANEYMYEQVVNNKAVWGDWFTAQESEFRPIMNSLGFVQRGKDDARPTDIILTHKGKRLLISPVEQNERANLFTAAVNKLGAKQQSSVLSIFGLVNSFVRTTAVSASPPFLLANTIRDPLTAAYNMQASEAKEYTAKIVGEYKNVMRALINVYWKEDRSDNADTRLIEEWEKAGGRISFVQSLKEMDAGMKSFEGAVKWGKKPGVKQMIEAFDRIEKANIIVENVMRLSTFKVMKDKVGHKRAARISKDLTTNFTRKGFMSSNMGMLYLFFNATIQGNVQVIKNVWGSKKLQGLVAGTLGMAFIIDLLGRALADDDEWDQIPEYEKERNIILPFKVGGVYPKIPAPWVYNVVWRMGGMIGENVSGVRSAAHTITDTTAMMFTTFNPMGGGTVLQALSPTALDPIAQWAENKNFAGNPLRPDNFPGASQKADAELAWQSTPKSYKWIAKYLNESTGGDVVHSGYIDVSPATIQNTVEFFGAGLWKFGSNVLGLPAELAREDTQVRKVPVLRQFAYEPTNQITVQNYYSKIEEVRSAEKIIKIYSKGAGKDPGRLQEAKDKYGMTLRMSMQVKDTERQLKSLRVRLRAAQSRGDEKLEIRLRDKIASVQKRFNQVYDRRVKS